MNERIASARKIPEAIPGEIERNPKGETGVVRRSELYIRHFDLPAHIEDKLSSEQHKLLDLFEQAVGGIEAIFAHQVGDSERAHFYAQGVSRTAIKNAAEQNPELLSPYTLVQRTTEGELRPIPMHEAYAGVIKRHGLLDALKEAAELAKSGLGDMDLHLYLRAKANSFKSGDYEYSDQLWLEREDEPDIDILIGFYDTYTDRFLGRKYAAQAWVGVIDRELTEESQGFTDSFLTWWENDTGLERPRIKMRIDHTVIMAGQASEYRWSGNNEPPQPEWRKKHGSKFTFFLPNFEDKVRDDLIPAFRVLINGSQRSGVTDNMVRQVAMRKTIAHELSHSLGVAGELEERLQQFAAPVKELYCDVLALKGYFGMEGINLHEKEVAFASAFVEGIVEHDAFKQGKGREEYYVARSVLLKWCLKKGSVKIEEDNTLNWEDPRDVINDIINLYDVVNNLHKEGRIQNVEEFFGKYFDKKLFSRLVKNDLELPSFLRALNL